MRSVAIACAVAVGAIGLGVGAASAQSGPIDPAVKNVKKVKAPSTKELHPRAIAAGQQTFKPSAEQMANARAIIKTGQQLKLPAFLEPRRSQIEAVLPNLERAA